MFTDCYLKKSTIPMSGISIKNSTCINSKFTGDDLIFDNVKFEGVNTFLGNNLNFIKCNLDNAPSMNCRPSAKIVIDGILLTKFD